MKLVIKRKVRECSGAERLTLLPGVFALSPFCCHTEPHAHQEFAVNYRSAVWQNNPEVLSPVAEAYGVDIEARLEDDAVWTGLAY